MGECPAINDHSVLLPYLGAGMWKHFSSWVLWTEKESYRLFLVQLGDGKNIYPSYQLTFQLEALVSSG